MAIYLLNYGLILFYWSLCIAVNSKSRKVNKVNGLFLVLICIQLVAIMGLREKHIGMDTMSYYKKFISVDMMTLKDIYDDSSKELGFLLLIKGVRMITDDFQVFLVIAATVSIVPIMVVIIKCSKKPFLSILIFIAFDYYAFMFSGMRQAIAYGLCFFSYLFIKEKKFLKFLIVVFLASQFHKSAYLFLPAYFVANTKINKNTISIMVVSFGLVFIFKERIFRIIAELMYDKYEIMHTKPFGFLVLIITITILCLVFKGNALKKDKSFNNALMLLCAGTVLLPFITIGNNAKRLVEYYSIFMILVIPGALDGICDPKIYKISNLGAIIGITILFVRFLIIDGYNIVPYVSFWG